MEKIRAVRNLTCSAAAFRGCLARFDSVLLPRHQRWAESVKLLAVLATVLLFRTGDAVRADDLRTRVRESVRAEIAKLPSGTTCGLLVETIDGRTIFSNDADVPLKPASVMKLFTTGAALHRLGPDFTYETRFYLHGNDLLVVGSGDPGLGDPRFAAMRNEQVESVFDRLAVALRSAAVTRIDKIAIDDSRFDQQYRHEDWPDDQADRWYQAPVGAVNFNDNCITPTVDISNGRPIIIATPKLPLHFFKNDLRVAEKGGPRVDRAIDSDTIRFSGTLHKRTGMRDVAVRDPSLTFGFALQAALSDRGIETGNDIVRRTLPTEVLRAQRLIHSERNGIRDIIGRCNTHSQNLFAECLMKSLAAYDKHEQDTANIGSWGRARDVLANTIEALGVDLRGASFRDGSGLSHENRVTAQQIVRLLQVMRRSAHWSIFRDSLANAGENGTLKNRYNHPALVGRLFGKTGTISGVRALAGYIERDDKPALVFALMVNGEPPVGFREKIAQILAVESD
ncbi:MAG: D-alanyl-D-alanine carboxypeptidase/D-alanyl-D-alanine-endopeptidase [Phycisphaerae bacterium]